MLASDAADRAHERFHELLLTHRGRTQLTQQQLASRVGVNRRSLQDWEAGLSHPTAQRLLALIAALLEADSMTAGREAEEAEALWEAVSREATRMHARFDRVWFTEFLAKRKAVIDSRPPDEPDANTSTAGDARQPAMERRQDWGEAPDVFGFVGRTSELEMMRGWLLEERCRVVAVLGMGGIGKTIVAAKVAQTVAKEFHSIYWRSLRNVPLVDEWMADAIRFLSGQRLVPPEGEAKRLAALLQLLRDHPTLLVLDNFEALLEPGQHDGRYREGIDGYGALLQAIGETRHQSCVLLTSREAPPELAVLSGPTVRTLYLGGLGIPETQRMLAHKQLSGTKQEWANLIARFGGNGLALKVVGESIREVFGKHIGAFLDEPGAGVLFGGIRRLLSEQIERSSPLERSVLRMLAVEREPATLRQLMDQLGQVSRRGAVLEALEALRRRSLVDRAETVGASAFTLQSVVLEYMTDRLVETVADEITRGAPGVLVEQPLIRAQAKDYVRQSQERLIGRPIFQRLDAQRTEAGTQGLLLALLDRWRGRPAEEQGYGPGNVVNLLRLLRGELRGLDLSRLVLRQVFLQGVDAQDASLAGASLDRVVLDETFAYPTAVALSADGVFLAAGTPTGEVRLWRAADRTLLMTTQWHSSMVWNVALSADGQVVASCGDDGKVQLWAAATGQLLATMLGHSGGVRSVALSADGQLVASGGWDGTVRLWAAANGQLLSVLQGHTGAVRCVALSGDGRRVASGGADGTVRLWETGTGRLIAAEPAETGFLNGVALSRDGQLLAGGGVEGALRLWDAGSGHLLATLQHSGAVRCVALSGDGRLAASGNTDGTVRLWETGSGQLVATMQAHTGMTWGIALSADGQLLASGGVEGAVRLWEASSGQPLAALQGDAASIQGVAVSGDGRLVASCGADGTVRVWESASGPLLFTLRDHTGAAYGIALSRDGRVGASAGWDGTVRLWEAATGRAVAILEGQAVDLWTVALSGDGQLLATSGLSGTVQLWDTEHAQPLAALVGHTGTVWSTAVSGDGRRVASCGADGTVRVWESGSGRLLIVWQAHAGGAWCVAISEDGRFVVSGGVDGILRLWDTDSGAPIGALPGHAGVVYGVALSHDSRRLASTGVDGTVRLWDVASRTSLATLLGHTGVIWSVALSGDGQLVASGGDDGIVRLWDAGTSATLRTLRSDRHYQRLNITGLTGVTTAQRAALVALGAVER